jgi:hypothetical protein
MDVPGISSNVKVMKELGRPSTAIRPPPEQKTTKRELIVIPPQKRPS